MHECTAIHLCTTFLEHLLTAPTDTKELHNNLIVFTLLAISNLSDGQSMLSPFILPHSSCFLIGSSTGPLLLFVQDPRIHARQRVRAHTHTSTLACKHEHIHTQRQSSHKHTKTSKAV